MHDIRSKSTRAIDVKVCDKKTFQVGAGKKVVTAVKRVRRDACDQKCTITDRDESRWPNVETIG